MAGKLLTARDRNCCRDGVGAQAVAMLAKRGYCEKLQDAAVSEIGIYQDARQIWIVLAAPFAPTVGQSEEAAGQRVLELVNQARATPRYCGKALFKAVRPVRWTGRAESRDAEPYLGASWVRPA